MAIKEYDYLSYEEYLRMFKNNELHTEYSDGVVYCMSPTFPAHNKVQNRLYSYFDKHLGDCSKCDVYTSDVAVKFVDNDIVHHFEPDVMITCTDKFDGAVYADVPYLIVEVMSKSTKDRDKGIKLNVFEKSGVQEYWIVDINQREITIYSDNSQGKYHTIKTYTNNNTIVWNGHELIVSDIFKNL